MSADETRRRMLRASAAGLLFCSPALAQVAKLAGTPQQTAGPFYPNESPQDDDNNLIQVRGQTQPARGTVTQMQGRVLDSDGNPIKDARVEIWQCDAYGRYHHERDNRDAALDPGFQGFGHTQTSATGEYRFLTIKPVAYPGRTPHIHYKVIAPGAEPLTTQMYVAGEPQNDDDFLYQRLDPTAREQVTVTLQPATKSRAALSGRFDIILA